MTRPKDHFCIRSSLALVSRPDEVINKDEFLARVRPGLAVKKNSLRFHIACRRAVCLTFVEPFVPVRAEKMIGVR